MDANFFYYSIYDRFVQRQPCACVCACICKCFFKKLLRNYQLNLRNFTGVFLRKLLFTVTEKSGLWSDTSAQALLVMMGTNLTSGEKLPGSTGIQTQGFRNAVPALYNRATIRCVH